MPAIDWSRDGWRVFDEPYPPVSPSPEPLMVIPGDLTLKLPARLVLTRSPSGEIDHGWVVIDEMPDAD